MKKNTDISERLLIIIELQSITPNLFAKKLGYERSQTIYDVINGKSAPSYDFFKKFINAGYSEVYNLDWLISGKGEMLKHEKTVNEENEMTLSNSELLDRIERLSAEKAILENRVEVLEAEKKIKKSVSSCIAAAEREPELSKKHK